MEPLFKDFLVNRTDR